MVRSVSGLLLVTGLWLAPGAAWAADPPARQPSAPQEDGAEASDEAPRPGTRERLERMRGTGSRAGFDHDTRPRGPLAQQFGNGRRDKDADTEPPPVPARPTRWRQESVGGTRVQQVRFRRRGAAEGEDDSP